MISLILHSLFWVMVFGQDDKYDCTNWRNKLDEGGNIMFIAGDRDYYPPITLAEVEPMYCSPQLINIDKTRAIARNCMKPFPRQIIGLMTYGSRKDVKSLCKGSDAKKQDLLDNNICFRDQTKLDIMHDSMDKLIIEFETVRDDVHNESLKIPHICCQYSIFVDVSKVNLFRRYVSSAYFFLHTLQNLKADFYRICKNKQIDYWIDMTERKLDDALDIMCGGYRKGSANNKCPQFIKDHPFVVPANKKKKSVSLIIALVDVLSQLATVPEESTPFLEV